MRAVIAQNGEPLDKTVVRRLDLRQNAVIGDAVAARVGLEDVARQPAHAAREGVDADVAQVELGQYTVNVLIDQPFAFVAVQPAAGPDLEPVLVPQVGLVDAQRVGRRPRLAAFPDPFRKDVDLGKAGPGAFGTDLGDQAQQRADRALSVAVVAVSLALIGQIQLERAAKDDGRFVLGQNGHGERQGGGNQQGADTGHAGVFLSGNQE